MSKLIVFVISFISGLLILCGIIFGSALILGLPVKWLWNVVCPELFNLPQINFWQSFCLLLLCGFLFKSSSSSSTNSK